MLKFLFIPIVLISSFSLFGQSSGSSDCGKLIEQGEAQLRVNPKEAISIFRESQNCTSAKNVKQKSRVFKGIGTAHYFLGEYDSTYYYWSKSAKVLKGKQSKELANAYNNLGIISQRTGAVDSSQVFYQKALTIRTKLKDTLGVAAVALNIGSLSRAKADYRNALKNYLLALKYFERLGEEAKVGEAYNSVGLVYMDMKEEDEALKYFLKSIKIKRKNSNEHSVAKTANNIAGIYYRREDYETAESYYLQCNEVFAKYNDRRLLAGVASNLGNIYKNKGEKEKAVAFYEQSAESFELIKDPEGLAMIYGNLAGMLFEVGDVERSAEYYQKSLLNAKKIGSIQFQIAALKGLSDQLAELGRHEEAWNYERQRVVLNDSIFHDELAEAVAVMQEKYEAEKKARKIQELRVEALYQEKENEQQRILIWSISLGSLLVFFVLILIVSRALLRKRLSEQEKESYRLDAELQKEQVDRKNRELTVSAGNILQKNQLLAELQEQISEMLDQDNVDAAQLNRLVKNAISTDDDWDKFRVHFEDVHPKFFTELKNEFPELTVNDLKNSAYIRMNLSTKDVALLMNISPKSAKMNRYRLKKKLNLSEEDGLLEYLQSF